MNRKHHNLIALIIILLTGCCWAANKVVIPDLAKMATGKDWTVFNRKIQIVQDNNMVQVQFNGQPGDGGAWLKTMDFANGVIECDIQGKPQAPSYVGIAFDLVDANTYDAVYFRAFNFRNPERKTHSVQYISYPEFTWWKLRQDSPGKYESAIAPAPDPKSFIHVKLVIEKPKISVYVNQSEQPCLVVKQLQHRPAGKIGLWVGNEGGGTFANLKIMPEDKPATKTSAP